MSDHDQPRTLKELLSRSEPDAATVERLWVGVHERDGERRPLGRVAVGGGLVALALLAGVGAMLVRRSPPSGLTTASGASLAQVLDLPSAEARTVALSDSSTLALGPGAMLVSRENSPDTEVFELARGRTEFSVTPGGPRRWTVFARGVRVDVVGTIFSVELAHDSDQVSVGVSRGLVEVSGPRVPGGRRQLLPGETFSTLPPEPVAEAKRDSDWLAMAKQGELKHAAEALGPQGLVQAAADERSAEDRLLLADVAAAGGEGALAESVLAGLVSSDESPGLRAVAAFKRGLRLQDDLGEPARAAQSFEQAVALGVPASLRRDASLRAAQAWMQAGDTARAREWLERADRPGP